MICPNCQFAFDSPAGHCPKCGVRIVRNVSGVVKTSSVLIAADGENSFYRSMQEVPEPLRRKLIETTNSENSGMIVIADRAGKEQWTEVIAHREAQAASSSSVETIPVATAAEPAQPQGFAGLSWAAWAGVLLFLAAGAMIASAFQFIHW